MSVPELDRGVQGMRRRWMGDQILRRMAANTLVLLGGKACSALLGLGAMALTVRALGLEGYGVLILIHTFAVAVAFLGQAAIEFEAAMPLLVVVLEVVEEPTCPP